MGKDVLSSGPAIDPLGVVNYPCLDQIGNWGEEAQQMREKQTQVFELMRVLVGSWCADSANERVDRRCLTLSSSQVHFPVR